MDDRLTSVCEISHTKVSKYRFFTQKITLTIT